MVLLVPRAAYLPVLRTLTLSIFFFFFLLSYTQFHLYAGTFRNVIVVEQLGGLGDRGGGGVKKMKVIVRKERKRSDS